MIDKFAYLTFATWKAPVRYAGAVFIAATFIVSAKAQSSVNSFQPPAASAPVPSMVAEDNRYRIGPGDVLTIIVRRAPELSGKVRVDQRGMIRIPMVDQAVPAACK